MVPWGTPCITCFGPRFVRYHSQVGEDTRANTTSTVEEFVFSTTIKE
jgi:hypothetical protein